MQIHHPLCLYQKTFTSWQTNFKGNAEFALRITFVFMCLDRLVFLTIVHNIFKMHSIDITAHFSYSKRKLELVFCLRFEGTSVCRWRNYKIERKLDMLFLCLDFGSLYHGVFFYRPLKSNS